jgi:hypothetical protein
MIVMLHTVAFTCACSSKRLKEDVNDGSLRGLLASHGVAAYLCGHLHGLFGQRQHLLHLGVGSGKTCFACHRSGSRRSRHRALAANGSSTAAACSLCSALFCIIAYRSPAAA